MLLDVMLVLSFSGCDSTIFATGDDQGKALLRPVSLLPLPVRREYPYTGGNPDLASAFAKTEDHLSVFAVYRSGNTQKLSMDNIEIELEGEGSGILLTTPDPYIFTTPGAKNVVVKYGGLSARYGIVVRQGGGDLADPIDSGNTSVGIVILWE
ncbi:MAG: hypothetical protein LBP76_14395 [Treponema sp.]|jgi:hypothetical protein|nr:hypothetical protein [Treponema sp.]